ncbi:MAG: M16 family metallopeptidase [Desulfovibrio sp.]
MRPYFCTCGTRKCVPPIHMFFFCVCAAILCSSSAVAAQSGTAEGWWLDGSWPHENSSLKPHPDAVFGRLDNGLRYVVLRHASPKGRAALYLNMQIGSFMEKDDQAGLAHYMEHMVFNGSTHFEPGELIKYFQSVGMGFGSDANAHTTSRETLYKLKVPTDNAEVLNKGLVVLADFLGGASILEQEVSNERGIILEEKAARDSERFRAMQRRLRFIHPDTRFIHPTIGTEVVIKGADAKQLRAFYDSWYRPELAVVVAVGDFDVQDMEKQIKSIFSPIENRVARGNIPYWGDTDAKGVQAYYDHRPGTTGMLMVEALHPRKHERDSLDVQLTMIEEQVAVRMLQARLMRLSTQDDAAVMKGMAQISNSFNLMKSPRIITILRDNQWEKALGFAENELRRALTYGFTELELKQAKKFFRNYFKQAIKNEAARSNSEIAEEIVACMNKDRVYQSPVQSLELFTKFLDKMTIADVDETFRAAWDVDNRLISLSGVEVKDAKGETATNPEELMLGVWKGASAAKVEEWKAEAKVRFPYLPVAKDSGKVVMRYEEKSQPAPYRYRAADYENGFSLFMKPTSVEKGRVVMNLSFGKGSAYMNDEEQVLARFALRVLKGSGVGRLSQLEQSQVLAGRNVDIFWQMQPTGLGLNITCLRGDMKLAMHLLQTALLNPVITQNEYDAALAMLKSETKRKTGDSSGVFALNGKRFLASGDSHFADLEYNQVEGFSLKDVRLFIGNAFRRGPVTLCASGDFSPMEMEKMAGRFFGTLPQWKKDTGEKSLLNFPSGKTETAYLDQDVPQAGVIIAMPVSYIENTETNLEENTTYIEGVKLRLLRRILSDRLRVNLRERLGIAYSPRAILVYSPLYAGYGYIGVQVRTEDGKTQVVKDEINKIFNKLVADGVTADELNRAVKQSLSIRKKVENRLGYWNSKLSSTAHIQVDSFARAARSNEFIQQVTVEDLHSIAKKYLVLNKAAVFTVLPDEQSQ